MTRDNSLRAATRELRVFIYETLSACFGACVLAATAFTAQVSVRLLGVGPFARLAKEEEAQRLVILRIHTWHREQLIRQDGRGAKSKGPHNIPPPLPGVSSLFSCLPALRKRVTVVTLHDGRRALLSEAPLTRLHADLTT